MTPEDAARTLAELFPPHPSRHGRLIEVYRSAEGELRKKVVTNDGEAATLELLQQHITGEARAFLALGYLPVIERAEEHLTSVGMIDLDRHKYAGFEDPPATFASDLERLKHAAAAHNLYPYFERSTRGGGHLYLFSDSPLPLQSMADALLGLVAGAGLALGVGKVETFPANDNSESHWYILPYARALQNSHERPGLGDTYLETAYGEAIQICDALEMIERCEVSNLERLATDYRNGAGATAEPEDAEDRKREAMPLPLEYFEPFKASLLKPPTGFERHSSVKAALNVFERMGRKREGRAFIEDDLFGVWIDDGSRNAEEWSQEVKRWAAKKDGRRYGLRHLIGQGFKVPPAPPQRITKSPMSEVEPEGPPALPLQEAISVACSASGSERPAAVTDVWRSLMAAKATHLEADQAIRELSRALGVPLGTLRQDFKEAQKAAAAHRPVRKHAGEYAIQNNVTCLVREQSSPSGDIDTTYQALANFHALIQESTVRDDGVERTRQYVVIGKAQDGRDLPAVTVSAREFDSMNWPTIEWGNAAVVYAGAGQRDHMRAATHLLSEPKHATLYTHTGFREIDGQTVYLHAAGAIGRDDDLPEVQVELSGQLSHFTMPPRPSPEEAAKALRASFALLDLAPLRVTAPLLAATYRAPLGEADSSIHVAGRTGLGKSQIVALFQQHSGPDMSSDRLPGSWTSTANALEVLAFAAKDELLVIDDFNPTGSRSDIDKYHATFERIGRAVGNGAGRGRLRPDGTLRPTKAPRALVVSTGEDIPRGHSLRARMLILELRPGDLDWQRLTTAQAEAAAGVFATARAGYISWLAENIAGHRAELEEARKRERIGLIEKAGHPRTADIGGQLLGAFALLRAYAQNLPGFDTAELDQVEAKVRAGILEAIEAQADHQTAADPVQHFLNLLSALIATGQGHLATPDGDYPGEGYGWRRQVTRDGDATYPQGVRLGWVSGGDVWLEPEVAFAEVQRLGATQSEPIPTTKLTLWKRLAERRYLTTYTEPSTGKTRYTWKKTVEGIPRNVLRLASYALEEVGKVGNESQEAHERGQNPLPTSSETVGNQWEGVQKVGNTPADQGQVVSHLLGALPTPEADSGKRLEARNTAHDASSPTFPTIPTSEDIPLAHETEKEHTPSARPQSMREIDELARERERRTKTDPPPGAPL